MKDLTKVHNLFDDQLKKLKQVEAKFNLDKMDYRQFVVHLESKGIKTKEETHVDIDHWFDQYIVVKPINSRLKERYFSTDGGHQLF